MRIEYIRSSLLSSWATCQQKTFFLYNLGLQETPNIKAECGTICHRVFETLAELKLSYQKTNKYSFNDKDFGLLEYSYEDFNKKVEYTFEEVEAFNKERINKDVYINIPRLKLPYHRIAPDIVEDLIKKSFDHYSSKSPNEFKNMHYQWCRNFTWIGLESRIYDPRLRDIVAPEINFDLPIEEKWATTEYLIHDQKIKDTLRIKGTIDLTTRIDEDTIEIIDWKGLPIDTPIPTINGWSTMGSLQIGDIIFDKDGNLTRVINKSQPSEKQCYKLIFDDKTEVVCDYEHLWMLDDNSVVPVTELKVHDKIDVAKPLVLEDIDLPIDPYILGLWLGNNKNDKGEIRSPDTFIFEEIERRGGQLEPDSSQNYISKIVSGLKLKLENMGLIRNKHIPLVYLRSSYNQRLDLLRGLMDANGYVFAPRKQVRFPLRNKRLSDNIKELLLTLGQRPNNELSFRPIQINPFLLPSKVQTVDINWGPGKSEKRKIIKIEIIDNKITQCIMVDSPTNTYLCTENMIPTHNTGQCKNWATGEAKTYEKLCEDDQLMLYYYAARRLFPDIKNIVMTIFFLRDGGPITISIDDSCIPKILDKLKNISSEIKKTEYPKLRDYYHKDFMCYRLCTFFKNKINEESQCSHIMKYNKKHGMDKTIAKFRVPGFRIGHYQNPGE